MGGEVPERVRRPVCLVVVLVVGAAALTGGCTIERTGDDPATAGPVTSGVTQPAPTDPSGTTTTTDPTVTNPAEPRQITVVMNGDMLLHEGLWASAQTDAARTGHGGPDGMDFRPILANMRPVVAGADLAICHLETPLAPSGGPTPATRCSRHRPPSSPP